MFSKRYNFDDAFLLNLLVNSPFILPFWNEISLSTQKCSINNDMLHVLWNIKWCQCFLKPPACFLLSMLVWWGSVSDVSTLVSVHNKHLYFLDHVYFVHRSTYGPTLNQCIGRHTDRHFQRPMYRLTYWSTHDWYFGQYISFNILTDISAVISAERQSTYCPTIGLCRD